MVDPIRFTERLENLEHWRAEQERWSAVMGGRGGGGGNTTDGPESRLARLETHMEYVRQNIAELKISQGEVLGEIRGLGQTIRALPTKQDLWNWRVQWTAICVATIAIVVGGIIGGLAWIKPDTPPSQPIVVQVPPLAPPAPAPNPKSP